MALVQLNKHAAGGSSFHGGGSVCGSGRGKPWPHRNDCYDYIEESVDGIVLTMFCIKSSFRSGNESNATMRRAFPLKMISYRLTRKDVKTMENVLLIK